MLWVLKHGLFSSPRKLSLWPKKCTFLLTPWPAVTDTQTFSLKAKRAETREDWLFWGVMEALILLPAPPEKCVCRPQELLTFRCSVLWFVGAALSCECLSVLGWPLENVEPVHFSREVRLTLSHCKRGDSLCQEWREEQWIRGFHCISSLCQTTERGSVALR